MRVGFYGWRNTAVLRLLTFLSVGIWIAYVALKSEERLIAVARTVEKTDVYLKKTGGNWPTCWEEIFLDEHERIRIQKFVDFDFKATASDVARSSPDHFTYIRPIGPCSDSYKWQISRLIETAKTMNSFPFRIRAIRWVSCSSVVRREA